nr:hypothetical protein [Tanacetum cinerariifolium]
MSRYNPSKDRDLNIGGDQRIETSTLGEIVSLEKSNKNVNARVYVFGYLVSCFGYWDSIILYLTTLYNGRKGIVQTSGSGNTFLLAVAFFFRQWEVPSGSGNFLTSSGNALCILFPTILP